MSNYLVGTISVLVSNILLSSYPILIKKYIEDISIVFQLILRCTIYIFLAIPFLLLTGNTFTMLSTLVEPKFLFISFINLIHIYTSYKGFQHLNAGVSLITFYTYPIIQIILSKYFLGTKFTLGMVYNLVGSLIGLAVLNKDQFTEKGENRENIKLGFIAIFIAALTEAIISIFYKKMEFSNPFLSLFTLYAPSFLIFLVIFYIIKNVSSGKIGGFIDNLKDLEIPKYISKKNHNGPKDSNGTIQIHSGILKNIILFNMLIGGVGYTLRLYSINLIPLSWFSSLSFTNGISVFLLSWLFLKESIKLHHILGSAIIFYNIYKIKQVL